jgi:hypothetical protein
MATPIKRIEKEFFLKVLYDEKIPLVYLRDQTEYFLTLQAPVKTDLILKIDRSVSGLKSRSKMELMFDFRGQIISFALEIDTINGRSITAKVPDSLYKNLDRSYARITVPEDMEMRFSFSGDRYNLSFPKVNRFDYAETDDMIRDKDPRNITGLIEQLGAWVKTLGGNYKLVIFKDVKPSTTEERIVAETGKAFFLGSTKDPFPDVDISSNGWMITTSLFKRYLESTGVDPKYLDETCKRFVQAKLSREIFSDAWIPIIFQEYVVGYIHAWLNKDWMPSFDLGVLNILYRYAKGFAYSLKASGFFENGRRRNEAFVGRMLDISVSGLLFAYPKSALSSSLLVNSELAIKLVTAKQTIDCNAKIVRYYRDSSLGYFGCRFFEMNPDDLRYLFEYLYGKSLSNTSALFQTGKM